jgi:metallo-beta-lactamase family protein
VKASEPRLKLEFLGAAGGVTGSRTLLTFGEISTLVDCGLFQGPKDVRAKNREPFGVDIKRIQCVVMTHAHLDHSGYLPRLWREGFRGPIYCSSGTADLLPIMLTDAAYLEEEFAGYANKSGYSSHQPALPLFTKKDVDQCVKLIQPLTQNEWHKLGQHISFRFLPAGHIIGASMVQFSLNGFNGGKTITFSGDLGHDRLLTMRGPEILLETDVLILESTYGNREHPRHDSLKEFASIANRTFKRGGMLIIPAFSVGRAQEIMYMIRKCEDAAAIPKVPVTLDSPMANAATRVFLDHPKDHKETCRFSSKDPVDCYLPALFETTETANDSMLACMKDGPGVVISAAGMLNGGRILHHLKARLPHEQNTILFCGYQAEGTKGRYLQDNASNIDVIRIHHKEVPILAEIATMATLSAHADWVDIKNWLAKIQKPPKEILLNHGSLEALDAMAGHVTDVLPNARVRAIKEPGVIDLF